MAIFEKSAFSNGRSISNVLIDGDTNQCYVNTIVNKFSVIELIVIFEKRLIKMVFFSIFWVKCSQFMFTFHTPTFEKNCVF